MGGASVRQADRKRCPDTFGVAPLRHLEPSRHPTFGEEWLDARSCTSAAPRVSPSLSFASMLSKVVVATLAIGASAFTPAPLAGSKVSMSRVLDAAPAPLAPEPVAVRAPAVVMSGDGEHETLYEMCAAALIPLLAPCPMRAVRLVLAHTHITAAAIQASDALATLHIAHHRFDPGWVVINMALWGGALLKFGGVF